MTISNRFAIILALGLVPLSLAACGSDNEGGTGGGGTGGSTMMGTGGEGTSSSGSGGGGTGGGVAAGDDQTPPQGQSAVDAWLQKGDYKKWNCEEKEHPQTGSSPHGANRICTNEKISKAGTTGEFPAGAAAVKEIFDKVGGQITGYAIYLKTKETSLGGANWYWYETLGKNVVADGLGDTGTPKTICVGCHVKAARDFVFTQVP